jgi:RecA-family ATPase
MSDGDERPLYRLPSLINADPGAAVYIVESEKIVEKLAALNRIATCVASGWESTDVEPLRGRKLIYLADNDVDGKGERNAANAVNVLAPLAASIRVMRGGPPSGNLADRLDDEISVEEFEELCGKVKDLELEQQEPPPEPLVFVDIAKWINTPVPKRRWAVLNRIPAKNVTVLSGTGGTGKTIIAMQLAAATVLGRDWFGALPEPGPVIFLSGEEDAEEMHRRFADITEHLGVLFQDLIDGGLHLIDKAGRNAMLACPGRGGVLETTALLEQLSAEARRLRPKLVILDNRNRVYGGNINDSMQVSDFISTMHGFAIDADTSVLLILHPSIAGMAAASDSSHQGLAGAMNWHDLPRGRMYFEKVTTDDDNEIDKDLRLLICKKNNYGPDDETVTLRWKTGKHGSGVFVMEAAPGSLEKMAADNKVDDLFLTLLQRLNDQNRGPFSHKKQSNNYAPTVFAKQPEAKVAGIKKAALAKAMERLLNAKKIAVETYGPPCREFTKLVIPTGGQYG